MCASQSDPSGGNDHFYKKKSINKSLAGNDDDDGSGGSGHIDDAQHNWAPNGTVRLTVASRVQNEVCGRLPIWHSIVSFLWTLELRYFSRYVHTTGE